MATFSSFFIGRVARCGIFVGDLFAIAISREPSPIFYTFRGVRSESLVIGYIIFSDYALIDIASGIKSDG